MYMMMLFNNIPYDSEYIHACFMCQDIHAC
jgi:hypothetical protein